jgi:hypothetical protein
MNFDLMNSFNGINYLCTNQGIPVTSMRVPHAALTCVLSLKSTQAPDTYRHLKETMPDITLKKVTVLTKHLVSVKTRKRLHHSRCCIPFSSNPLKYSCIFTNSGTTIKRKKQHPSNGCDIFKNYFGNNKRFSYQ